VHCKSPFLSLVTNFILTPKYSEIALIQSPMCDKQARWLLQNKIVYLNLRRNNYYLNLYSHNAEKNIDREGAIKLSEALKLNSSLRELNLSCNYLLLQFILTQYSELYWL
jgi:hypothetical protein